MFPERPGTKSALTLICCGFVMLESANAQVPVEPLLQKYCLGCHNDTSREAGLSLQTPESLKKGSENGSVFDVANPASSLLHSVLSKDSDNSMPPADEAQPTDSERELLRQWVLAGAKIQPMAAGLPDVAKIAPFQKSAASILASAVTDDGKFVTVGGDRFITLVDAATDKILWTVEIPDGKVTSLSFASRNPWVVAALGTPGVFGKTLILEKADGTLVKELGGHTDALYSAVLTPDDKVLASAGYDRRIVLHDVSTGAVLKTLDGHNGSVFSLCFDVSGKILCSASGDGTVKVWNVESGLRLDTLSQPQAEQYSVLFSKDGRAIFAAGADNRIRVWQLLAEQKPRINPLLEAVFAHEQAIVQLAISPSGNLLASAAEDGTLRIWSLSPLKNVQTLPQQSAAVTSLAFVGDSRLFVTHIDGTTKYFDTEGDLHKEAVDVASASVNTEMSDSTVQLPETLTDIKEKESNDSAQAAQQIALPCRIAGVIHATGSNLPDADCFQFEAKAGQNLMLEVRAAADKSPLDSRLEVLTTDGRPILRTQLQAVRDSYFTFRGKDSDTSDDFRVFNWQEMELNEYLYSDGEVVRLWLYPRGPDSGFQVYPGFGKRFTYFGTTPTSHALQAPCFVVVPREPGTELVANGLPTFPIYYENDDDPRRELGSDSRLHFRAPSDGNYVVRITDARGFGGENFSYQLDVRSARPSFEVTHNGKKLNLQPGTGREIEFKAKRIDGYEGPITIDVESLPSGIGFSGPVVIEEGQLRAFATLFANSAFSDAAQPTPEQIQAIRFVAAADGHKPQKLDGPQELTVKADPKIQVRIEGLPLAAKSDSQQDVPTAADNAATNEITVLQIRPGQTIQAMAKIDRLKHTGIISFGKEDSGRNLPHGVFVDNIGLNGLLLLEGQSDRDFFITAAKWVKPSRTTFFLKSNIDGITTLPVVLEVLPAEPDVAADITAN